MKLILKLICLTLSLMTMAGCTGRLATVSVDAIRSPATTVGCQYILASSDCLPTDPQFLEFASYTRIALQQAGYTEARSLEEADVLVVLDYDISAPYDRLYTWALPTFGETGTADKPRFGVTGTEHYVSTKTLYDHRLCLSGYDRRSPDRKLWETKALCSHKLDDLRVMFPVLLVALTEHIATDSGRKISRTLAIDATEVRQLREAKSLPSIPSSLASDLPPAEVSTISL